MFVCDWDKKLDMHESLLHYFQVYIIFINIAFKIKNLNVWLISYSAFLVATQELN